jgi:hypothetical protein
MSAVGPKGTCLCYLAAVGGKADISQQLPNNRDLSVPALVALPRFAFHQLHQSPRILRRRALLVVVEIDEHRAPLAPPFPDVARPGAQRLVRILILVAAGRAVPAHIDMARRHLPRRRRVVMIRQAERDVMMAQKREDVVRVPALVPKLECVRIAARQHRQERRQPLAVFLELRRKLEQHGADLGRGGLEPRLHQRDRVVGLFAQPFPVRDEFRRLPGKQEVLWGLVAPAAHGVE